MEFKKAVEVIYVAKIIFQNVAVRYTNEVSTLVSNTFF